MDWFANDTSAGLALIALGHSGSDTFDSMFVWPRLALCAATGDPVHAAAARMALLNSKQPLDLSGAKGYAHPGCVVARAWVGVCAVEYIAACMAG
jgi:hypothetical protein